MTFIKSFSRALQGSLLTLTLCSCEKVNYPDPKIDAHSFTENLLKRKAKDTALTGTGVVTAHRTVEIKPRIAGQLSAVLFHDGQNVKRGEILAQLEPAFQKAVLEQADANRQKDSAILSFANKELNRDRQLFSQALISQQQLSIEEGVVEQDRAQVNIDETAIAAAQLQLSYTNVVAPIDGRVGLRSLDAGSTLSAGDSSSLSVIATISQLKPVDVICQFPARYLNVLSNKNEFFLAFDESSKKLLGRGRLVAVDSVIDNSTGMIKVKTVFPNTDLALWPNQFVRVEIEVQSSMTKDRAKGQLGGLLRSKSTDSSTRDNTSQSSK